MCGVDVLAGFRILGLIVSSMPGGKREGDEVGGEVGEEGFTGRLLAGVHIRKVAGTYIDNACDTEID